jgi:hypothetical protein
MKLKQIVMNPILFWYYEKVIANLIQTKNTICTTYYYIIKNY